jgi:LysM repeat protein
MAWCYRCRRARRQAAENLCKGRQLHWQWALKTNGRHDMKRFFVAALAITLLAITVTAVSANQQPASTVTYVVKPGDTLAKIARQFCTSWNEIYYLNRATIGPNPNHLTPGTVLVVPNKCSGSSPGSGVYDRGPSLHARGHVSGDRYTVAVGDTIFSISARFGVTENALMHANGLSNPNVIFAGQILIIPGLSCPPPPPSPYLKITSPAPGAVLPATFVVSGSGAGLFEGNVLVRALNASGVVLAQQTTTLNGSNVGAGGEGTFSVQMTVNVAPGTAGTVEASSPQSAVSPNRVPVVFGTPSGDVKDFAPGACQLQSVAGAPYYAFPNGPEAGRFGSSSTYSASRGAKANGMYWYMVYLEPNTGNPPVWVPATSVSSASSGCKW